MTHADRLDTEQPDTTSRQARRWLLTGQVQGVGFRPFVYRLAHRLGVSGWVRNRLGEVEVLGEGTAAQLEQFARGLIDAAPRIARPHILSCDDIAPTGSTDFTIHSSAQSEQPRIQVPTDYFACDDCLAEVDDPDDRRHAYPFTNCTQCGPRYTLIARLPYDRPNTSLVDFPLCPDCAREYADPLDRRFHAEPIACPVCGPQLTFVHSAAEIAGNDAALRACSAALQDGAIVAIKGVGGYHLVCDARNAVVIARLRARKPRPAKPLAVMFADTAAVAAEADLSAQEHALLVSPMRPIVLARKRTDIRSKLADNIAPGLNEIGVLLPYSPLHHLLCRAVAAPLVVTSGNLSGEPVLTDNDEAATRLAHIADAFLQHNRPIVRPADDPVFRSIAGTPRPLRIGRGNAPLELPLARSLATPTLAVGGHLKLTVCLAYQDRAIVSPHIGDMGSPRSQQVFEQVCADLQTLYGIHATRLVCDAHPDYHTTRWATRSGLPLTQVQHHHAHASALVGEQADALAAAEDWLVFAWDGTGYGNDGTLWGGETLHGNAGRWQRVASFRPFRLPGGDKAGREPWRSAAALCWETGADFAPALPADIDLALLRQAWQRGLNAPQSSAVGRLFDACASLADVLQIGSFEGQGPMYLEALCDRDGSALELPLQADADGLLRCDWTPLIAAMRDTDRPRRERAATLHATLARTLRRQAERLREHWAFTRIGLTGGVFQNARLAALACRELAEAGFTAVLPERLPCNDAGISFGQVIESLHNNN